MTESDLENRVSVLEQQMREVVRLVQTWPKTNLQQTDWRQSLGMFTNRPFMRLIDNAGHQLREMDRQILATSPDP